MGRERGGGEDGGKQERRLQENLRHSSPLIPTGYCTKSRRKPEKPVDEVFSRWLRQTRWYSGRGHQHHGASQRQEETGRVDKGTTFFPFSARQKIDTDTRVPGGDRRASVLPPSVDVARWPAPGPEDRREGGRGNSHNAGADGNRVAAAQYGQG
ncbi:hypothetical protein LX32DRAFT_52926 [Colletotrichum zoysiae]|uniref:Uncharacterized protein n=1 Tax=Colletotrichum zoysiae TaxID=1216348 RepID=A0AAD9HCD3_9PEZI|nr:hypothetical protein LX32DRAFT_52926 [Colletotrichum zoysiae]